MQIKDIVNKHGRTPDKLIRILTDCQKLRSRNYLTNEDLRKVAAEMGLPESRIYSVATFYSLLSVKPRGRHIIQLCRDVPCYVNGSFDLKDELEKILQISIGESTRDGLFSLEFTSCLGHCENPPAMRIDHKIYGGLTGDKLIEIISAYRKEA